MSPKKRRRSQKLPTRRKRHFPGAPPGTLRVDPEARTSSIQLMAFSARQLVERPIQEAGEIREYLSRFPVTWIHVEGLKDLTIIRRLGEILRLHKLALEDVVEGEHRPKFEQFDEHDFVVATTIALNQQLEVDQLSICYGQDFVITFLDHPGHQLDPVRRRLRDGLEQIRASGPDYLAYALLDALVDSYFPVLERYGERLEELEDVIIERPDNRTLTRIRQAKRELLVLRRSVWPLRDTISRLTRQGSGRMKTETQVYLRDCHDHIIQLVDLVEAQRDMSASLMDAYMSSLSMRMNEIMKVLSIVATIFIPLTFVTGLYGMNFKHMPELDSVIGYPGALTVMLLIAGGMYFYFRRKGWLGGGEEQ